MHDNMHVCMGITCMYTWAILKKNNHNLNSMISKDSNLKNNGCCFACMYILILNFKQHKFSLKYPDIEAYISSFLLYFLLTFHLFHKDTC